MKTIRLLLTISLALAGEAQAQSFLTNGLVAYYPFNGNANDASGNGRNGTVVGATLVMDRFGNATSAYSFASQNDSIVVANSLHPQGQVTVTYSCWVLEPTSLVNDTVHMSIINCGFGGTVNARSELGTVRGLPIGSFAGIAYTGEGNDASTPNAVVTTNVWHHLVITKYQTNVVFYMDGKVVGSGNTQPGQNVTSSQLNIGWNGTTTWHSGEHFNGFIDDVRIYNRALSVSEVHQLYGYESQTHWDGPFQIVAGGFSWTSAKADAESRGGHLATFGTQAKWNALVNEFSSNSGIIVDAWIGGHQAAGNTWTWITGEPWTFSKWWPGDPKNSPVYDSLILCWGGTVGWANAWWNDTGPGNYEIGQFPYILEIGPRVDLIKAVKPSFSYLALGTNYQLQVSGDLNAWTNQGSPFTATNSSMVYPQYFDVDNWNSLFFRLQVTP
jgi:hypothetical protein